MATETPTALPSIPNAFPRSAPLKYCWIMATPCGLSSPEPTPCTKRATISMVGSGARPAAIEDSVKMATPSIHRNPRPNTSPARPPATRTTPKVSA